VTSDLIAGAMQALGRAPAWQGGRAAVAAALAGHVRAGDLVITMGAGDVTRCGPELLAALRAAAA
jgi:UDP-N-acetylmuramate--alanine ligase